jgi:hypothetical protein
MPDLVQVGHRLAIAEVFVQSRSLRYSPDDRGRAKARSAGRATPCEADVADRHLLSAPNSMIWEALARLVAKLNTNKKHIRLDLMAVSRVITGHHIRRTKLSFSFYMPASREYPQTILTITMSRVSAYIQSCDY